jgi:hypothetical protein
MRDCRLAETKSPYFKAPKARSLWAFAPGLETLRTKRNAWWRREDSNYVPGTQSGRPGLCSVNMTGLPPKADIRRIASGVRSAPLVDIDKPRRQKRIIAGQDLPSNEGLPGQDSLAFIVLHAPDYHDAIRCDDALTLRQDEKWIDLGFLELVTERTDHF